MVVTGIAVRSGGRTPGYGSSFVQRRCSARDGTYCVTAWGRSRLSHLPPQEGRAYHHFHELIISDGWSGILTLRNRQWLRPPSIYAASSSALRYAGYSAACVIAEPAYGTRAHHRRFPDRDPCVNHRRLWARKSRDWKTATAPRRWRCAGIGKEETAPRSSGIA